MSTAQQILVVYGVIIAYGLVLGVPLAAARSKAPHVSRHLVTTHLSAIMQGPVFAALRVPERADISTWGIAPKCRSMAGNSRERERPPGSSTPRPSRRSAPRA